MKDFVRESWKIAAAFAAGAFLLSLLIGLMTRNPFGTVFFRALLLALLFGVLGGALRYVLRTYLSDISGAGAQPAAGEEPRGSRVDIVVGDDAATGRAPAATEESHREEAAGEGAETVSPAESAALGELAEELEEDAAAAGEEVAAAAEVEPGAPDELSGVAPAAGAADVDELPDLEPLDTPPRGAARAGRARGPGGPERSSGQSPEDVMRDTMARQDPATLARALRTVLKKDEKG